MAITADQISVNPDLAHALGAIGTAQQPNITAAYAKKKQQMMSDALPGRQSVLAPGSYANSRMTTGENLSQGNLQSGMEQVLGNTSYADWKANRDYQQNYALSKLAGQLFQPNKLEQALSGLGTATKSGAQLYGLYKSYPQSTMTSYTPTSTPNYGYYNSGGSGLNLYGN